MSNPHTKTPLLSVRGLVTDFPLVNGDVVRAVNGVDFDLNAGEILGIVGESGSGKSVLIRSVLGIVEKPGRVTAGSIRFKGQELVGLPEKSMRALRGRDIAMIFQNPAGSLSPVATIADQFAEALRAHERVTYKAAMDRATQVLTAVGLTDTAGILAKRPYELPSGLIQRIMIGLAMVAGPDLILADEPTTSLDVTVQEQIVAALRQVQRDFGTSVLFISHDMGVISEISDRIMVMYGGKVIEEGGMREILTTPEAPYTRELIASVPKFAATETPDLVKAPPLSAAPRLTLDKVSMRFEGHETRPAVSDVSLSMAMDEAVGIVGESGAGKSVLLRMISGLYRPSEGKITAGGLDIGRASAAELKDWRRQVQIVFQNPYTSLPLGRRIRDVLAEPLDIHGIAKHEWDERIQAAVAGVKLPETFLDRRPEQLSGGQRQRVAVARALVLKPKMLLLDEPVSALDVSIRSQVLGLLSELRAEQGLGFIVVSHDFSVLRRLTDRINVMRHGRFVESGPAEQIMLRPAHDYTKRLIAAIPTIERSLSRDTDQRTAAQQKENFHV